MKPESKTPQVDPSTYSNYQQFQVIDSKLHFDINFEEKLVDGTVTYNLIPKETKDIVLDTSYLTIKSVFINDESSEFSLEERKSLGSPLKIVLKTNEQFSLKINFQTTKDCTALQFLNKNATDGKEHPYLFSQCQAIHARSLFPCFDTPAVKSTYSFSVTSPYPSLMSGRPTKVEGQTYYFNQPIPIPSYLISLASGDISKSPIGSRSHVYCEPIKLNQCQHEFEQDMEPFIQTAESIVFPYEWDQYDVLVLPSSFPYGGMENPNITFATPTLISGDRENVDVLAHELAHSWLGNLVTNCSWEHFWLNEGWTVYLERLIQGKIHGEPTRHFSAIIGWSDLENTIKSMGDSLEYSKLVLDLKGVDPDDSFSTVPYEKGFNLLFHIENVIGKAKFDKFIPYYFNKFKYKSLDTYQFLDTLYEFFSNEHETLDKIDWDSWLFKPGMPPVDPKFDTTLVDQCYNLADRWFKAVKTGDLGEFSSKDIESFSSNQSVVFLDTLESFNKRSDFKWSDHKNSLVEMSKIYSSYTKLTNCEVLFRWFILQVDGQHEEFYKLLGEWLGTVGRMKFVRPGYILLNKVHHQLAIEYFSKFENNYHPICKAMVKKDLGLD